MSSPASNPSRRSLVLVAGSGRSGTSVFSGVLQRLGFRVPTPEVTPDATNPRGFAESQWVVDFHQAMLTAARVQTSDGRPSAWAETARVADEPRARELRKFLKKQFADADHVLIKDPRLIWFLLVVGSYVLAQYLRVWRPRRRGAQPAQLANEAPVQPADIAVASPPRPSAARERSAQVLPVA